MKQIAVIQSYLSKSSSCKESLVCVKGIMASVQPKLGFFLVLVLFFDIDYYLLIFLLTLKHCAYAAIAYGD